ncbi:MAG: hypothetical protein JWL66_1657 [Sphingomonadales bacterium]|nr:hypothetical protein [Sphingomonadales bacterium]
MLVQHAFAPNSTPSMSALTAPDCKSFGGDEPPLARAMAQAKVGAWSCNLADETLSWTSGIYDIFGLPTGTRLDRRQMVEMYAEESRAAMERLRAMAIAERGTFALDAEIVRADGGRRWMRLTGELLCRGGQAPRLHGMKQDITEEKLRWEAMRRIAENDALTGLASRSVYESRFLNRPRDVAPMAPVGALVLFDMDRFKRINDGFGHVAGDTCLRAFAERLSASFPEALLTARIGGDEFAMIVGDSTPPESLRARVAHFLAQLRSPVLWQGNMLNVMASTGIAVPPNPYSYDPEELFVRADAALYVAKRARHDRIYG